MKDILQKYLPEQSIEGVIQLLKLEQIYFKIVPGRVTKYGDYRKLRSGQAQISVNGDLNPYRFLITTLHEIAHAVAFKQYGINIKPHGKEWKLTFQKIMIPFLKSDIFPEKLLFYLKIHFQNPRASTDTDVQLALCLDSYNKNTVTNTFIYELLKGAKFRTSDGRVFIKDSKKTKRYVCIEEATGQQYLFQPNAVIEPL